MSFSAVSGIAIEGPQRINLPLVFFLCFTALQSCFCQVFSTEAHRLGEQHYLWPTHMARNQAEDQTSAADSFKVAVTYPNPNCETSYFSNLPSTSGIMPGKESISGARREWSLCQSQLPN